MCDLNGKMIRLRKIDYCDTDNIIKWRNTESVRKNLYVQDELTKEQHIWWLENRVFPGHCVQYIIEVNENGVSTDIGTVFIKNIDTDTLKGEYGIQIGEESARGKGYGTEAAKQLLKIAFTELNLNRVYLTVLANNIGAIKSYKKAGFIIEGTLKSDYKRGNQFFDVVEMAILKSEWEGKI